MQHEGGFKLGPGKSVKQVAMEGYEELVQQLVDGLRQRLVPKESINQLLRAIPEEVIEQARPKPRVKYDDNFNLSEEVAYNIQFVRQLRENVMRPDGTINPEVTIKEANSIVSASNNLLTLLNRTQKDMRTVERAQAMERAVTATLEEVSPGLKETFLANLKFRLEEIEQRQ